MRVAMLGTGTMGAGMARSMARAGLEVTAWNRTPEKAEAIAGDGVQAASSITAALSGADAVITMLFDVGSVLDVSEELLAGLGEAVWLQSATVGPDGIARIAERAGSAALLDAPVLGTKQPAEEGKLVPIVSGPAELVERVRPVLDAIGVRTVVAGERVGQASALKLACNAWIFSITAATGQSLALANAQGIDPQLFLDCIAGGPSDCDYAQLKGKAMLRNDFSPSFTIDGGRKDLDLIDAMTDGTAHDLIEALRTLNARTSARGHGGDDLAAVYDAF